MLLTSILSLLLSNAVTMRRDISLLFNRVAIIALIYSILHSIITLFIEGKGINLHGGLLNITNITQIFDIFIFFISILILQLTSFYPRKVWIPEYATLTQLLFNNFIFYRTKIVNKMGEHLRIIEYPLILLFIISGAVFLISTSDLISVFLSIELQSYGLYLLSTIYRNSELSTTGGLMYFLLGGLSSTFILLGTSLLYANSGTTNLDALYAITSISDNIDVWYKPYYINFSLLIFSIGFLFKVSAAPFHFWSPEVYDAIPTIVTTFVAIIAKISIFVFLLEIVYYTKNYFIDFNWTYGLLISSLFSMIIGTIVGLTQFRIKRLFAYSTISHVGFILLALSISSIESTQAFIFYLMQYSISNLNAFLILITIGFTLYYYINENKEYKELLDKDNSPIQLVSQLKGYFYINPTLSLSLIITIFSFAGIPPLVGFFAKQMVLSAALDNGYIFLSIVAILTSVVGAVYYLNIIKEIFFFKPESTINPLLKTLSFNGNIYNKKNILIKSVKFNSNNITISSPISITISIITLIILLFIFVNKEWLSMSAINTLFFLCVEILFVCNLLLLLNKNEYITYNYSNNTCVGEPLIPSINLNRKYLNSIIFNRSFSTSAHSVTDKNKVYPISPWFISGYTDAEGCFNIGIQKNSNGKYYVKPSFQIKVHSRDSFLLMNIKHSLGDIGNIYTSNTNSSFTVKSLDHLLKIIEHFNNYPLITQKKGDFILFKEIIYKIVEGEHLSAKGLQEIVNIRSSINLGLSSALKTNFPDTIPVIRPNIENVDKIHPEWMSGFVSGEGCFSVHLSKYGKGKLDGVSLSFKVSQHSRDELLLKSFISFFECGLFNYHDKNKKAGVFIVRKFSNILDKILPFFEKHPIIGVKKEDYKDWIKVIKLIKSKDHLTENGIEKIRKIKLGMNTQR